jgi:CRISPR-associated protein (TIGR02584 family)
MNVLICLLGLAPGVATGAYYALARDRGVPIDRLVTLTTSHPQAGDCEREITTELQRWCREKKITVEYDNIAVLPKLGLLNAQADRRVYRKTLARQARDICRLRIPYPDVNTEEEVAVFREAILALVQEVYREDNVYLCLAGGRKSMAGIAAIATQLYGDSVQGLYHLYVLPELEQVGMIDELAYLEAGQKQHVLRPEPSEVQLVEIPYLQVREASGQFQLVLKGNLEETTFEYLRQHSLFVEALDQQSAERYWDYVFEVKTADYVLRHKNYPVSIPNHRHPDLPAHCKELDVYAKFSHERFEKRLVVECKLRHIPNPDDKPVDVSAVEQIIRRLEALKTAYEDKPDLRDSLQGKELHLEGWVVCNANAATPEAWKRAQEAGVKLLWADLPRNWRTGPRDWQIARLLPIPMPQQEG